MASRNRGNSGSGHGWAGVQTMFYNCIAPGFWVEAAPGTLSWVIGSSEDGSGKVQPPSLFKQQLKERLNERL
jgi:hypothetical protein